MKTLFSIIGILALLILVFAFSQNGCSNEISRQEFNQKHEYLNKRVDTVIVNQLQMQKKIDSIVSAMERIEKNQKNIIYSIDTLKAGQILIYSEVTNFNSQNETKQNWANYLLNFLN